MNKERIRELLQLQALIESDIAVDGHQTFDAVITILQERSGAQDDIFTLADSNSVKVQLAGANDQYCLELYRNKTENNLYIQKVDENRCPLSDSYGLINYDSGYGPRTGMGAESITRGGGGHSIKSMDLATFLDDALGHLNNYNWRLTYGNQNVPVGQV